LQLRLTIHSSIGGRLKSQNMRTKNPLGSSMTEDVAIAIDWTTLQSVYTCTQPGMAPGRCTTDRAHPTVRTLGSYGPILQTVPPQKGWHRNCEMPPVATRESLWEGGLTSTSPPLIPRYPSDRYGSTLAELNSTLTPRSARWCVRKVPWSDWPTRFQTGASSYPPGASKTPTPRLRKPSK
jgi:hypothetical protein